jgi:hypothetical protein
MDAGRGAAAAAPPTQLARYYAGVQVIVPES